LILLVDDFGCYDGRASVITAQAFGAFEMDRWPNCEPMLVELHRRDLIVRYANKGKPYLGLMQWRCGIRGARKFPAPPINIDLPYLRKLRGVYGKVIGWCNPPGCEPVSTLIDVDGRVIVPQPAEWRDPNDWSPIGLPVTTIDTETGELVTGHSVTDAPVTGSLQPPIQLQLHKKEQPPQPPPPKVLQSLVTNDSATASTTAANGKIGLEAGAFTGVTDAQCERWQGMFASMSIPDQLDRAAAWLEVNQAERDAIAAQGDGFGPFLVRWLLREARGTVRAKGGLDS
jgi:hypothetical protein